MSGSARYLLVMASGVSCLILFFILNYQKTDSHEFLSDSIQDKRAKIKDLKLTSEASDYNGKNDEVNYSRLLLADSVLSIVKNYYVDRHRTTNRTIILGLLNFLKTQTSVVLREDSDFWYLSKDGSTVRLARPARISYDLLLHHILTVGNFLKEHTDFREHGIREGPLAGLHLVLKTLLLSLDAHSTLLSAESYHELRQGTEGTFGGLGVLVGMRDQLLTVLKPLPSSPAERVGILRMDRILSIDGKDTYGYSLGDLVEYMRGAPGTRVNLSLLRDGDHSVRDIQLEREIIKVDSVSSHLINKPWGSVLYASIESFTSRTSTELLRALLDYRQQTRGKDLGLILDLRSNPGGLLDQAVYVADLFVDKGVIVSTKGRSTDIEYAHYNRKIRSRSPVIVLINNESASASEIVAGALQDHNRALVIGQPSFGKGSVQTIFELPDERALKLTIARYYTPLGKSIQNVGIVPDIWMQPVIRQKSNDNLLGSYRYKSERFLPNHLLGTPASGGSNSTSFGPLKGYFLSEHPDQEQAGEARDQDLELALSVFEVMANSYGKSGEFAATRAGNLLALASGKIREFMKEQNQKVENFLKNSFGIAWGMDFAGISSCGTGIQFSLAPQTDLKIANPGEELSISYSIRNVSGEVCPHISVFLRHQNTEIDTREILIGDIGPGQLRTGEFRLKVPSYWKKRLLVYEAGLAFGAQAEASHLKQIRYQVKKRKVPDITIQALLTDEVGGQVNGELEPDESARLLLKIQNNSGVAARSLEIRVINLAGNQLILMDQTHKLKYLAPFQNHQVHFALKGAERVVDPRMGLGLFIESSDLPLPIKKKATISSVPGQGKRVEQSGRH